MHSDAALTLVLALVSLGGGVLCTSPKNHTRADKAYLSVTVTEAVLFCRRWDVQSHNNEYMYTAWYAGVEGEPQTGDEEKGLGFDVDVYEEWEREGEELVVAIGLLALWIAVWGVLVLPWGSVRGWDGGFEGDVSRVQQGGDLAGG